MESIDLSKELIRGFIWRLKIYRAIEDVLGGETHQILKEAVKTVSERMDLEKRRIDCLLAAQGK